MNKSMTRLVVALIAFLLVAVVAVPIVQGVINNKQSTDIGSGKDGKDGEDGITPQLRINYSTNEWEYSYTQGVTWQSLGVKATGAAGKDGADGVNGTNGTDGKDGQDGQDGKDGVSPRIRINTSTSEWEISTDEGLTWESTGVKASGEVTASLTIDSELSETSVNAVQNKVITSTLNAYSQEIDTAFAVVRDLIDDIKGLPEVSTDDDGKGLIVQGGEWVVGELPETPTQEKTIEITESGTYEITPDAGYALSKVLMNINVASAPRIFEYLPETTFTNGYQEGVGAFVYTVETEAAVMDAWVANTNPVIVVYDGEEYICTPQVVTGVDGSEGVCVGSLEAFGGSSNGEPFVIAPIVLSDGCAFLIGSTVDTTATEHTIRVYQEVSSDNSSAETNYRYYSGSFNLRYFPEVNGATWQDFYEGGALTVPHDIGEVPDIFLLYGCPSEGSKIASAIGFSEAMLQKFGDVSYRNRVSVLMNNGSMFSYSSEVGIEFQPNDITYGSLRNFTKDTFMIGSDQIDMQTEINYLWVAICGLT